MPDISFACLSGADFLIYALVADDAKSSQNTKTRILAATEKKAQKRAQANSLRSYEAVRDALGLRRLTITLEDRQAQIICRSDALAIN